MIRPALPADSQFVISGWSSSYRMSRDSTIPMPMWADTYHPIVRWYMARPNAVTLVSSGADVDARRGFICYESNLVHYVYVAEPFRGHGIARELFAAASIDPLSRFEYTHRTKTSWECRGKIPSARHNSYRGRFPEEKRA